MKTLSIRQPWAWLIVNGHKPIENRTWNTKYRGPLLVHASKSFDRAGYEWVREHFPEIELPALQEFERGGVVGIANMWEVVTDSSSGWFNGPFGFCLARAQPVPFERVAGRLGFFDVPFGTKFAPVGTRAPAIMGGSWYKTDRGWKWNGPDGGGSTFPRPGGDWDGRLILPDDMRAA